MKNITVLFIIIAACVQHALAADWHSDSHRGHNVSLVSPTVQFADLMASQTNGAARLAQSNLLVITSFFDSDTNYCRCEVKQESSPGHILANCWEHCRWCSGTFSSTKYDEEVKRLCAAIAALPAHNESPPIGRLVVVSFAAGTNWTTRTYDRQSLPDALLTVCKIMGDGFELRDKDKFTRENELRWP